ncbi:hypothetical protein XF35_13190 [Streptomyces platensis subsp. clarensis]|nr:hypothetical protein [Streptomyces platensis subsp. clarensis]
MRRSVGGDQGVLHGIGGLFAIPEGAQCHRPETVAVPPDDLPERLGVTSDMASDEVLITRVL